MTRTEFTKAMAYLTAGSGKALSPESMAVYFDCLADISFEAFSIAAKRVLMEHHWATFPSIAELRKAASLTIRGELTTLSPAEAWAIAWRIAGNTDPEVVGSFSRASVGAPQLVLDAIRMFGLLDLCYGKEPVGVIRGQFMKTFEQLAAREDRAALLPTALKAAIADTNEAKIVKQIAGTIGAGGESPEVFAAAEAKRQQENSCPPPTGTPPGSSATAPPPAQPNPR